MNREKEFEMESSNPDLPEELFQIGQSAEIGRKLLERGDAALL